MLQRSTVTPYAFCCGLRRTARSYMSGCCGEEAESGTADAAGGFAAGTEPGIEHRLLALAAVTAVPSKRWNCTVTPQQNR